MQLPKTVKIVEVGPRDGLQNEAKIIPTAMKIDFINQLSDTGLKFIEITGFVSPRWIPQMADAEEVATQIKRIPGIQYSALVPNITGMEKALKTHINQVAVFTAASETFSKKNINCSIEESLMRFEPVIALARENKIPVRGYISCALGCPYEGEISPDKVAAVAKKLRQMGCEEISLGDTIGVGTPRQTINLIETVAAAVPQQFLAVHFHDTYGQALANIFAALQMGINVIDAAVGGLGGCPYAPGASGNVATEDVVYLLNGLGIETGIDLKKLVKIGESISEKLGRTTRSKTGTALLASCSDVKKSSNSLSS